MPLARIAIRLRVGHCAAWAGHGGVALLSDAGSEWIRRGSRHGPHRCRRRWAGDMNAYEVLFDHHKVLRGLCKEISDIPPETEERRCALDELLVELDIHMRIEDDLFYPA